MTWKTWPINPKYEASSSGEVRNCKTGRVLKPWIDRRGYKVYAFRINGRLKTFRGHRIVASAFLGESSLHVNHKNLNPSDNRVENLEYCTPLQNTRHAISNGVVMGGGVAEKNGRNVYSSDVIRSVKLLLKEGISRREISRLTGVHRDTVRLVDINKNWKSLTL